MATQHRAYARPRDFIEHLGGTMSYQRKGFQYGAWVISLNGKSKTIRAKGNQSFRELDRLYVPKLVKLSRWMHTHDKLLDDAEEHLLKLLAQAF